MANKLHMKASMRFLSKEVPTLGYNKVFFWSWEFLAPLMNTM
jgi:hypothetical protein